MSFSFAERGRLIRLELGLADHHVAICLSRLRWVSPEMKRLLQKESLWEDLIQELYATAFEAWKSGIDDIETRRFAQRRIYAFLRACGFRKGYLQRWTRSEKSFAAVFKDGYFDKGIAPREYPPLRFARREYDGDHLDEKILAFLRKHPEGLARCQIGMRFQIPVQEVDRYLAPVIKQGEVVEIKRENTRGRPLSPLLVVVEPGQALPEPKMVKTEQTERIRKAYFVDGWSIKRINRELHHDKRIIRRAIYGIHIKRR